MASDKAPEDATASERTMERVLHDRFVDLAAEHLRYLLDNTEASAALFETNKRSRQDWAAILSDRLGGTP